VAVRQRDVDASDAEADDVEHAVVVDVGEVARVIVDPPALAV